MNPKVIGHALVAYGILLLIQGVVALASVAIPIYVIWLLIDISRKVS